MSKRSPGEGWGSLLFAGNIGAAYERPVRLRRKVLLNWRFQPEAGKASLRKPRDDRVDQGGVGCATDTGTLPPVHLQSYRHESELHAVTEHAPLPTRQEQSVEFGFDTAIEQHRKNMSARAS